MKTTKRWLSLLLSLIMVVGFIAVAPVSVSAATYDLLFPVNNGGKIAYAYGYSSGYFNGTVFHNGIDIHSNGDDNIYAVDNGTVMATANACYHVNYGAACEHNNTFGNYIKIKHSNGTYSYYGHLKQNGIKVSVGDTVTKGQAIATMGSSGYSTGKHLHFELRLSDQKTKVNVNSAANGGSINYSTTGYNGTHTTHSYDTYVYYWASHPHYKCYKCSCGEVKENRDEPTYIDSCAQCRVGKTTVYSDKDVYCPGERIELSWDVASNATHYNFYIMKKESNGEYTGWIDFIREYKQTSYSIHGLPVGDYMIRLYSYDSKHWEPDGSDWCHEMADLIYFSVKEYKVTPVATTTFNNNTYEIYNISMPWTEAKAYCEYLGGHLVTITSQGEQDTVRELVSQGGRYCYWMGMTDEADEGNWVNITGEPVTFLRWITGEPNNESGIEHYGVVRNLLDENNWNDVKNTYSNASIGFICEYEKNTETIEFTLEGGENFVSVSWTKISGAVKYVFSAIDKYGNVNNINTSEANAKWDPNKEGFFDEGVRIQVKAYDSSDVLIGESPVEVYDIVFVLADWWGEYGDADFDEKITIKDATAIQKYIAGIVEFSGAAKHSADVVNDSTVNIKDATAIQKFIAGLETDSRVGEDCFYGCQIFEVMKNEQQTESDWVLASQVPSGAEITQRKWTYDKTETTTSTSSSMSGWTMTGSSWEQTGSGTHKYASYPGGFSTSNSLYSKYSKSAISSSETETAKRTVSDASVLTYIYWHWCRGDDSLGAQYNRRINEVYTSEFNTFDAFESTTAVSYDSAAEAYKYVNTSCCGDCYWWMRTTVYSQTYTDYQKIYSFSKTIQFESDAAPSGSSISNVQEWVKYMY